jgi:RNA methyltransferase, TrmH family
VLISSISNARVKQIRALRHRKAREATGLYFAEGIRIVTEAAQFDSTIESLVVAPELLKSAHALELVAARRQRGVPVLEVSRAVFEALSSREGPQGLGAVMRQQFEPLDSVTPGSGLPARSTGVCAASGRVPPAGDLPARSTGELCWIALDAAQDPGNIGTILRTSDAVGGAGLILLGQAADPYDPAAVRASMGALFAQRLVRAGWDEFVTWKHRRGVTVVGTSDKAAHDYRAAAYPRPMVLLLGSEREGLSAAQQQVCDRMVRIPMVGRSDSLNLAVATAVVLYEVFNQQRNAS